jgi:hypothetical protein
MGLSTRNPCVHCVDLFFASYFGVVLAFEPARSVTGIGEVIVGFALAFTRRTLSSSGHILLIAKLDPFQESDPLYCLSSCLSSSPM